MAKMEGKRSWVTAPVKAFSLDLDSDSDDSHSAPAQAGALIYFAISHDSQPRARIVNQVANCVH